MSDTISVFHDLCETQTLVRYHWQDTLLNPPLSATLFFRMMLLKDVERVLQDHKLINKVAYDLGWAREPPKESAEESREMKCSSSEISRDSTRLVCV